MEINAGHRNREEGRYCITFGLQALRTKIPIAIVHLMICFAGFAQQDMVVQLLNREELPLPRTLLKELEDEGTGKMDDILFAMYNEGFLLARWDTVQQKNDTLVLRLVSGQRTYWLKLESNSAEILGVRDGLRKTDLDPSGDVFRFPEVVEMMDDLLTVAEENGYPFATVKLDSIGFEDSLLYATLNFQRNRLILFDTIEIAGDLLLSDNFLQQYVGIRPGEPYKESAVRQLEILLNELPYATQTRSPVVRYSGDRAKSIVFLDQRNANRFDLVVGFLPNNEITGRLIVTGQGVLSLQNSFGQGEKIDLRFSKLESTTKSLNLGVEYPYLPSIPIGLEGGLDLFLKDSTFLERRSRAGLLYRFTGNKYIKIFASWYNSTVLDLDTSAILANKVLPTRADMRIGNYGIEVSTRKLDYLYNPRRGWQLTMNGSVGRKEIRLNPAITELQDPLQPEFDFTSLYDSIELNTLSLEYNYDLSVYLPLGKSATFLTRLRGAANLNSQLFENELYRIGGNSILRGFDELSLFFSEYHMLTGEARYIISRNGYAALFADIAYTVNRVPEQVVYDLPIGFGAGLSFETKAGIFGLSYALGRRNDNPLLFRNAKIHFGYVNYF